MSSEPTLLAVLTCHTVPHDPGIYDLSNWSTCIRNIKNLNRSLCNFTPETFLITMNFYIEEKSLCFLPLLLRPKGFFPFLTCPLFNRALSFFSSIFIFSPCSCTILCSFSISSPWVFSLLFPSLYSLSRWS